MRGPSCLSPLTHLVFSRLLLTGTRAAVSLPYKTSGMRRHGAIAGGTTRSAGPAFFLLRPRYYGRHMTAFTLRRQRMTEIILGENDRIDWALKAFRRKVQR